MTELLLIFFGFQLGIIAFPFLLFLRARRDGAWDDSNMTNIFRVLAHLATHPSDFSRMQYSDGTKPFWYISEDELSDVVKTRPPIDYVRED